MLRLLANRFMPDGPHWIDLATGARVGVRLTASGTRRAQLAWSERCERQALLRHPLLNPLVDFGAADAVRVFESYAVLPPVVSGGLMGVRLVRHGVRFLSGQSVPLTRDVANLAVRQVTLGPYLRGRPLGVVLQARPILERIGEALASPWARGVCTIGICCPPGSGRGTLRLLIARVARLAGFVPVCAAALGRFHELTDYLRERHVLALLTGDEPAAARDGVVKLITALGATSTRRHIIVALRRGSLADRGELIVERLGGAAMNAMIHRDEEYGPAPAELEEAIRLSDGLPRLLIQHLHGLTLTAPPSAVMMVHETAPAYAAGDQEAHVPRRRISRALARAEARGRQLAASGRHAAAHRVLERAARVLEARAERDAAGRCRVGLAWLLRDRLQWDAARTQFDLAAAGARGLPAGVAASIGLGVLRADEGQIEQSEAILRAAVASAVMLDSTESRHKATLALARTLLLQGRAGEASAVLETLDRSGPAVEHAALASRVYLALGDGSSGMQAATRALLLAQERPDTRDRLRAARAVAEARLASADAAGARHELTCALRYPGASRIPLAILRLRALLLSTLSGDEADRLARRLRSSLARLQVPSRLRAEVTRACDAVATPPAATVRAAGPSAPALREFLELAHGAPDDRTAAQEICQRVLDRLAAATVQVVSAHAEREVLVRAGRPWQGTDAITVAVLSGAGGVPPSNPIDAGSAAEPVRYGPEIIAALVCRWAAGTSADGVLVHSIVSAAALAIASTVRGLLDRVKHALPVDTAWSDLLGTSAGAVALRDAISRAARAPFPVLIEGESGSGKELVARAIHRLGTRRDRRLCTINCAAITEDLLEAELFGHARGAFTGATAERAGLFEEADGGALFLDEVGELTPRAQAKLLRVLQDGEVRRVGENLPRRVDTRVIAATNRSLHDEVCAGRFRADLRFRLDVIRISVPPLRERVTDIPALAAHFWADAAARVGSRATLAPETLSALARYDWPGNVRELQNAMAAIAVQAPRRGRVTPALLPGALARAAVPPDATFEAAREDFERRFIRAALARAGGHRGRAARALGITRQGFAKMLRRLQIDA